MNQILRDIESTSIFKKLIKNDTYPVDISGLVFVAKNALIASLNNEKKKPVMVVTYNEIQAHKLYQNLKFFTDRVFLLPKKEIIAYDYVAESKDLPYERIEALNSVITKKNITIKNTPDNCKLLINSIILQLKTTPIFVQSIIPCNIETKSIRVNKYPHPSKTLFNPFE